MKKEKKEMIRNLLYSFCIHLLFLLIIIFNNDINELFNQKIININSLNITSDFLTENKINTTDKDLYPDLTLNEKIELYNIAKKDKYNPNVSDYSSNDIKDIIHTSESEKSRYVLYLGPTDYKRYMARLNQEKIDIEIANKQDKDSLENILDDIASDIVVKKDTPDNKNIQQKTSSNTVPTKEKKQKLNIDPDKIFTKTDIKQIEEIINNEKINQSSLSYREKTNIQNQLILCYKNALLQTSIPSKVPVSVTIRLFPNGIIDTKKIHFRIIDDENKFTTDDYNNAINNTKIALAYCNPLRNMPQHKYSSWQNINFIFDVINR